MASKHKGVSYGIRLEPELKIQVDSMCDEAGVEVAPLLRALLKATVRFYKDEGYLHLPLVVYPANSAALLQLKAAERKGKFRDEPPRQRRRRERPSGPTTAQPPRQSAA